MPNLVHWKDLPKWVPGDVLLASDHLGWRNVGLRSYHYCGQDVIVPSMQDFMLVSYRAGITPMQRRFEGPWSKDTLAPGLTSLLTRAQEAHWCWKEAIDVVHIYLSSNLVTEVASEVLDCLVSHVDLADVLSANDPLITLAVEAISNEARVNGLGGSLYVDSVARALIIHLLRNYASIQVVQRTSGSLSRVQERIIVEYIDAHLAESMDLAVLSSVVGMTPCLFARQFKASFNQPPYAYVIKRRLERAKQLLTKSALPIKEIAFSCGFSDQAHLTRLFCRSQGLPPGEYRKAGVSNSGVPQCSRS